ncbi:MAG: SIS domain-containing protein [Gemmatimonadota bacterium]|nr:SIS domain-containing protein [Gemmatimonadota bacterium]
MTIERDFGREMYPFLHAVGTSWSSTRPDIAHAVGESTREKCRDAVAVRRQLVIEYRHQLVDAAIAMAGAFSRGGKLLAFGNGGSATDAEDAVTDCMAPPVDGWRALPAIGLTEDSAIVTAIANDVGAEHIFARQVIALGARGDIALGFSTSGSSPNVVSALKEAKRRGLLAVAFSGGDGGAMARASDVTDFCFVARLDYIPRIQEGHATAWHVLLELVQDVLSTAEAVA